MEAPQSIVEKMIFVYNADSGLANLLLDGAHKILNPSTYACSLCSLTYGAFQEKALWKEFRKGNPLKMEFLHRDEFKEQYGSKFGYKFTFPIVLAQTSHGLQVCITTEELNALEDAGALIDLVGSRV